MSDTKPVAYIVHDDPELGTWLTRSRKAAYYTPGRRVTPLYSCPRWGVVTEEATEAGLRAWLDWPDGSTVTGHSQLPRMRAALEAAISCGNRAR